jgi:hypothetical protein
VKQNDFSLGALTGAVLGVSHHSDALQRWCGIHEREQTIAVRHPSSLFLFSTLSHCCVVDG